MKHHRFTNKTGYITVRDSESGGIYKSQLEKHGAYRKLLHPGVKKVRLQEPILHYLDAHGKKRRYTADLSIEWHNPSLLPLAIEVKYKKELTRDPKLAIKFELVRAAFAGKGIEFLVETEDEILAPGFEMMRFVIGFRNNEPTALEKDILTVVQRHGEIALGELLAVVAGENSYTQAVAVPAVWRLVSIHQLRVDFTRNLDSTAKISVPPAV